MQPEEYDLRDQGSKGESQARVATRMIYRLVSDNELWLEKSSSRVFFFTFRLFKILSKIKPESGRATGAVHHLGWTLLAYG